MGYPPQIVSELYSLSVQRRGPNSIVVEVPVQLLIDYIR